MMTEEAVPYAGWAYLRNIGDKIGPNVIENVSRASPVFSDRRADHVLSVGSILFLANQNSYIWGSGSLWSHLPDVEIDPGKICALRGSKTADLLTRAGYRVPDVPFGDPGILISDLLDEPSLEGAAGGKIAIVPHYSNYLRYRDRFGTSSEFEVLDLATDDLSVVATLAKADIVISESLHGLVFASAFGKKTVWIGEHNKDNFKYYDWLSTTDCPDLPVLPFHHSVEHLASHAEIVTSTINKQELRESFPRHLIYNRKTTGVQTYKGSRDHEFYFSVVSRPKLGVSARNRLAPAEMFAHVHEHMQSIFAHWDEPVYAVLSLQGEGAVPTRSQIKEMIFELDHHYENTYAVIISREQARELNFPVIPCGRTIAWCPGKVDDAGTIMIRPDYENDIGDYVIFCV